MVVVGAVGLIAMLIQGCKREQTGDGKHAAAGGNQHGGRGYEPAAHGGVQPAGGGPAGRGAPPAGRLKPPGRNTSSVKGDTFAKIAKKNGVSVSAIESREPGR